MGAKAFPEGKPPPRLEAVLRASFHDARRLRRAPLRNEDRAAKTLLATCRIAVSRGQVDRRFGDRRKKWPFGSDKPTSVNGASFIYVNAECRRAHCRACSRRLRTNSRQPSTRKTVFTRR